MSSSNAAKRTTPMSSSIAEPKSRIIDESLVRLTVSVQVLTCSRCRSGHNVEKLVINLLTTAWYQTAMLRVITSALEKSTGGMMRKGQW